MKLDISAILNFAIAGLIVAVLAPMVSKAIEGSEGFYSPEN